MLRTTLKQQRHQSARHTRRAVTQRGGAAWASIAPERVAKWTAALAGSGLEFVLTDEWKAGEKAAELYVKLLAEQDTLFAAAVKCMYNELGIGDPPTESDIIEKYKASRAGKAPDAPFEHFVYLEDAEKLISFSPIRNDRAPYTKLQQITLEDPLELLLNPSRATNTFMKELASVCIMQKNDPTIVTEAAKDEVKRKLRYLRYQATAEGNALQQTNAHLRDGYYVGQKMNEFDTDLGTNTRTFENKFWTLFLQGAYVADANALLIPTPRRAPYGRLAAYVYNEYKKEDRAAKDVAAEVLTGLSAKDESDTLRIYKETAGSRPDYPFPNSSELEKKVIGELTLGKILANIDLAQLQFIVHLCKTIELNEAEVTAAVATQTKKPEIAAEEA